MGVLNEDIHVAGRLSCSSFLPPDGSISDAALIGGITATKVVSRLREKYAQESATTGASESRVIHVAHADGTIVAFKAGNVVACAGASTITFDLKKNGSSVLTAVITINSSKAAREVVEAVLSSTSYVAGDVFEVAIVATVGGGTIGKGAFCEFIADENPQ